jgi:hypothetical protein
MSPGWGGRLAGPLVAAILVVAFSAIDYLLRPRLPTYFGDNDVYVLVILLAAEFVVIWGAFRLASARRGH